MVTESTLAAFVKAGGGVELRNVSLPQLNDGDVLIAMKASGVCGTDLEKVTGKGITSSILGHEVSGIISESTVDEYRQGDFIIPHHHVACNSCELCRSGAGTMCESFKKSNFVPGGFANEFVVPEYNVSHGGLHKASHELSFEEASFAEPLACCVRGLSMAGALPNPPSSVLLVGAGPIGLLHMELVRSNARETKICAVDVLKSRLDFAEKHEGAIPIDASKLNGVFSREARTHTKGLGFDLVIIATGSEKAFGEGLRCARKSGTVLLFGAPHRGSSHTLDLGEFFLNEATVTTSYSATEPEITASINLLEKKKINVKKFVTGVFPLEKISDALDAARLESQVKTIVTGSR